MLVLGADLLRGKQTMGQTMGGHESCPQKMYSYTKSSHQFRGSQAPHHLSRDPSCARKALVASMGFLHRSEETKTKAGLLTSADCAKLRPSGRRPK